jgi:4-amino-4-deoxy-L-arabinose transferase-like glycosyltransferase
VHLKRRGPQSSLPPSPLWGWQHHLRWSASSDAVLVSLQSVLVGLLAARIFHDRLASLLAAAIVAFYPYMVFTQGQALSETPFMFLLVAGLLATYAWRDQGADVNWKMAAAVAILTAATMTKAVFTVLPPVLVTVAAAGKQPFSKTARIFGCSVLVYAALMSPWWVRNYYVLGEFVPFTTSSSRNLYMGNSPNNPDVATYEPYLPADWATFHSVDLDRIPEELERDHALRDSAVTNILEAPGDFFRRALIKLSIFWSIVPNAPAFQKPLYRFVGAATFGPVLIFAIVSAVRQRRQFLLLLPFYITIAYFTAIYTVTIASIRYRLPIEPLLVILGACPLAAIVRSTVATLWPRGITPERVA